MHRLSLTALAATAAVAACQQQPEAEDNVAEEPTLNLPAAVPRPEPPLGRAALLAAVAEAASATAAGDEMPQSVRQLDGRQFEIRIRFGCRGPVPDLADEWLGWSFDPEERRMRLKAMPTLSKEDALVERISGEEVEAVEGFWIPRPWLLQPVCPAGAAVRPAEGPRTPPQPEAEGEDAAEVEEGEPVPTAPRVGIAQFFTEDDPRTRRRDMRPYEARQQLEEGQAISSQGYNLVLRGRLRGLPGRGVIECSASGPDSPPECIVSAQFQRVWIEQPGTGEVIAQWGGG